MCYNQMLSAREFATLTNKQNEANEDAEKSIKLQEENHAAAVQVCKILPSDLWYPLLLLFCIVCSLIKEFLVRKILSTGHVEDHMNVCKKVYHTTKILQNLRRGVD